MTELIRPALYGARHPIVALTSLGPAARRRTAGAADADEPTRVEGPICESTDALGMHDLPPLRRGDLVAISDAGAYAASLGLDLQRAAAAAAGPPRGGRRCSGSARAGATRERRLIAALRCDDSPRSSPLVARSSLALASPAAPARRRRRRRPARPSRTRSTARPSTTTPGSSRPTTIAKAEATIDAIEARTGAEVVVYTQDSGDVPDDRRDRGEGARPDRPVGRRAARASTTGWSSSSTWSRTSSTARSSCTPAPASRRRYLVERASARRSSRTTCCRYLRDGDFDGALAVALAKVDAAATPEHAAELQTRPPGQRGRRARRRADRLPRPVRLGVLPLAPVRQGPGLPRRPVDPDAGAAARPDGRVRGDGHGRLARRGGR